MIFKRKQSFNIAFNKVLASQPIGLSEESTSTNINSPHVQHIYHSFFKFSHSCRASSTFPVCKKDYQELMNIITGFYNINETKKIFSIFTLKSDDLAKLIEISMICEF